jgi:hypothetical protein
LSFQDVYKNQVALLLEVLPVLNDFKCFALKGGTAINLFIHDMPRLSVDIDLTYLPIESRDVFLPNIEVELLKMKQLIEQCDKAQDQFLKLVRIKIENLPGIQWKLQNINKIPEEKKIEQLSKLKRVLEI